MSEPQVWTTFSEFVRALARGEVTGLGTHDETLARYWSQPEKGRFPSLVQLVHRLGGLPHVAELAHPHLSDDTTRSFEFNRGDTALNVTGIGDDALTVVVRACRGAHVVAATFEIPFASWDLEPWKIIEAKYDDRYSLTGRTDVLLARLLDHQVGWHLADSLIPNPINQRHYVGVSS